MVPPYNGSSKRRSSAREHRMRQVIIRRGEDGYWVVECPSLPGCISQGSTREEALINIREAIQLYVDVLTDEGRPVPEDHLDAVLVAV
jgi:predicted RNase H-like HicB family nuclease